MTSPFILDGGRCGYNASRLTSDAVYNKLGYEWATTLLAFLTVAMMPFPSVLTISTFSENHNVVNHLTGRYSFSTGNAFGGRHDLPQRGSGYSKGHNIHWDGSID